MKKKIDPYKLDKKEGDRKWTKNTVHNALPIRNLIIDLPEKMAALSRKTGRPKLENPKVHTALRLDADVLAWLKSGGTGYQTRANAFLRAAMELHHRSEL